MKEKLSSVLTRKVLLQQAGKIYFARGEKYYRAGNVKKLILSDNTLIATVPEDSAQICNALLEKALQPTGNDAYKNAIKLLKLYKEYMIAAKQEKQFQQYCLRIRNEYKKRKNLIALMNKNHS